MVKSVKRLEGARSHGPTSITQPQAHRYRRHETEVTTGAAPSVSTP